MQPVILYSTTRRRKFDEVIIIDNLPSEKRKNVRKQLKLLLDCPGAVRPDGSVMLACGDYRQQVADWLREKLELEPIIVE